MEKLLIITFGDSLTVGFQSPTMNTWYTETPYAGFLSDMLNGKADILVKGINGELTEEMVERFERDVVSLKPHYVTILGGTNDIGWGVNVTKIMQNLFKIYKTAIDAHIKPVAITVPSLRDYDPLIAPRQLINDLIKKKCHELDIPVIDLFRATAEKGTNRLAMQYSNDGLHLSTAGYRLIAELLYNEIFSKIY
ncbi:MAG: GDSL-type esterase/lipase family protein [Candidatus Magnetoovum sp. WYHC-5]|nr:GDSL-type esterase/lipase family protein [Candidatus Magnetoovum sp. WYHC-5]